MAKPDRKDIVTTPEVVAPVLKFNDTTGRQGNVSKSYEVVGDVCGISARDILELIATAHRNGFNKLGEKYIVSCGADVIMCPAMEALRFVVDNEFLFRLAPKEIHIRLK